MSEVADVGKCRFRMAGLGFGLPLSRVYARYFGKSHSNAETFAWDGRIRCRLIDAGGDLQLKTLPGYGVDAFLILKRLNNCDWKEGAEEYNGDLVMSGNTLYEPDGRGLQCPHNS